MNKKQKKNDNLGYIFIFVFCSCSSENETSRYRKKNFRKIEISYIITPHILENNNI
jgi:hypothetical protein